MTLPNPPLRSLCSKLALGSMSFSLIPNGGRRVIDIASELSAWFFSTKIQDHMTKLVKDAVSTEIRKMNDGEVLNVAEAAKFLSMSEGAVRKAAERGQIPCFHIDRRLRFRRSDLLNLGR